MSKAYQLWAVWGAFTENQRGIMVSDHDTFAEAQIAKRDAVVEDTGIFDGDAARGEYGQFLVLTNQPLTISHQLGVA